MKLGNGLGASGAYFLKVFLGGASWAVGLFWGVSKLACSEECAQVVIFSVCYEWRICSVWQVAWCGIDIWATIHMSLSERCNLPLSSGGWFEERRGGSRVVTNPTVWVRDRHVSIIDHCYRWHVSGWVFIFTDLQRMADLFDLTSCVMS